MPIPVRNRLFQPFLGTQEGIGVRLLTEAYSPRESLNVWIDELGRLQKFGGYRQIGPAPGGTTTWRMGKYMRNGTGTNVFLIGALAGSSGGLNNGYWYETATPTLSGTMDVGWNPITGTAGYGDFPDMAQMGNDLIITRPGLTPGVLSGNPPAFSSTAYTQIAAPTYGATAAGNLTGVYRWKVLPVIGQERKWASSASAEVTLTDLNQIINWTADADTDVTGYEIYRTTGTGQSFWYVDSVTGRTTVTYTDNIADSDIIANRTLLEHGDPPPAVWYCETFKQRMWYANRSGGSNDDIRTVWYSDPGDYRSVFQSTSFFNITDERTYGDEITGLTGDFKNTIVVWFNNSVYTISGTGQVIGIIPDWTLRRTNATTGCISHRTVAEVPTGAKYTDAAGILKETSSPMLAYITPMRDIRLFDGQTDQIISHPVSDTLADMYLAAPVPSNFYSSVFHDRKRGLMIWYVSTEETVVPQTAVVWNYRVGTWHVWDDQNIAWAFYAADSSDSDIIVGLENVSADSRTLRMYEDSTRATSAFTSTVRLNPLYFGDEEEPDFTLVKRYRYVDFLFEKMSSPATMSVKFYQQVVGQDENLSGVSADLTSTVLTSLQQEIPTKLSSGRYLYSRGLNVVLSESDTDGLWALEGIRVGYQVLPSFKRD